MLLVLHILAFLLVFTGVFGARGSLYGARGEATNRSGLHTLLGLLGLLAALSLVVWGFFFIIWYLALGTFVLAVTCAAVVMDKRTASFWFKASPWLNATCLAGAMALWVTYRPWA
jgi:hypothetical protein